MADVLLNVYDEDINDAVLDHKNSTIAATKVAVNASAFTDITLTNEQLVAAKVDSNNTDLTTLKNQYELIQYYARVSSGTSGTLTIPTSYTIELNRFGDGVDCLIQKEGTDSRPIDLGFSSLPASAAAGVMFTPDVQVMFDSPIAFCPGEYVTVTATPMVAYTSPNSSELVFSMTPIGYRL